jgi:N-acetylglucosaminyl-diphospho-decaprenol L-rhamnosyltransferase
VAIPIIIVSYNTRELLRRCLDSLRLARLPVRPVVVDNASDDGSAELVRRDFPEATLIESGANLGFARANNLGLRQVLPEQPDYVLFLNPDAELTAGALETLAAFLDAHPRVGMVAPRLVYPDGSHQPAAFHFPTLLMSWFDFWPPRGPGMGRLYDHPLNGRYREDGGPAPFAIDHPLGAAMLVRAATIAEVGAFNEDFWLYAEEVEWCWRIRRAGWAIWQQPQATVIHAAGASSGQFRTRSTLALQQARLRFFNRAYAPAFGRWHRRMVRLAAIQRTLAAVGLWRRGQIDRAELRRRTWTWAELRALSKRPPTVDT